MNKQIWLLVPAVILGLALVVWGGVTLAKGQDSARAAAPVNGASGNVTDMVNYCRTTMGISDADWTKMTEQCQGANGMMGGATGQGMMRGSGSNNGGMMGNGSFGGGMMGGSGGRGMMGW